MTSSLARGARDVAQGLYGVLVPNQSQTQSQLQAPGPNDDSEDEGSQAEYQMQPPPDMAFDSREKLLEYLKNWAASQGYAVVIGRSRTNRLWIRCDRGGTYNDKHADDPSQRQRKRKVSRLTGCGFSVKASMRKDGIWRSRCESGDHNHGPSEDLRDHPSLRRMNDEQLQLVYHLTADGLTPADIMLELTRRWPDIKVIRRDIYNARKNYKTLKDSGDGTPREFEDPNGKIPGPTDNGRWAWVENGDQIKKKRRLTRNDHKSTLMPSANTLNLQLPAANDPFASSVPRSAETTPQAQDLAPTWNRMSTSTSTSQSPALPSHSSGFRPPPTSSAVSAANRLNSPQTEYPSTSASHTMSGGSSIFNFGGSGNRPAFPQQILAPPLPTESPISNGRPPSAAAQSRTSQRSNNPHNHIHPELRNANDSGSNSPVASRQQQPSQPQPQSHHTQAQLLSQLQQAPAQQSTNGVSRPGTSNMPSSSASTNVDSTAGVGSLGAGSAPGPSKPLSGAMMMQRLQRVEDELKEQKSEMKDQKSLLTEILAVVQSLKG